jgi:steroid delta-isomerase-like uncharacterized protein
MEHETRTTVENLVDAWNRHDAAAIAAIYSPAYTGLDVSERLPQDGPDGAVRGFCRLREAFPDLRFAIESLLVDGERAALCWTATGTHAGTLMAIPRTGRRVRVTGITLLTVAEGRIETGRTVWDVAGALRAMGLLPDLT